MQDLLGGTTIIKAKAHQTSRTLDGNIKPGSDEQLTLIPYALWNNRGPGQMMVWIPAIDSSARPLPALTIAFRSKVSASKMTNSLNAVNDQYEPSNSNDHSWSYYHWWPDKDQWEWVQYDFARPETISKTKVYWFDDGPDGGCRIPEQWELLYKTGTDWKPVRANGNYTITKDNWDAISFQPVTTSAVRIRVKLNKDFASGIHEWIIE
jgi:hypothetical protein